MPTFEVWNDEEEAPFIDERRIYNTNSPEEAVDLFATEEILEMESYIEASYNIAVRDVDTKQISTFTIYPITTVKIVPNTRSLSLDEDGYEKEE